MQLTCTGVESAAWVERLGVPVAERLEEIAGQGMKCEVGGVTVVVGNRKLMEAEGVRLEAAAAAYLQVCAYAPPAQMVRRSAGVAKRPRELISHPKSLDVATFASLY